METEEDPEVHTAGVLVAYVEDEDEGLTKVYA